MKQRSYALSIVATLLAVLVGSTPVTAGEAVPFKARSGGITTDLGFDPVRMVVHVRQTGKGQATHLGNVNVIGNFEVDVITNILSGTEVMTAANGDVLLIRIENGHATTGPTAAEATGRIIGGTGRFQGATGLLKITVNFAVAPPSPDPIPYTDALEGAISFNPQP